MMGDLICTGGVFGKAIHKVIGMLSRKRTLDEEKCPSNWNSSRSRTVGATLSEVRYYSCQLFGFFLLHQTIENFHV